jgi:mannose-1-phosphate guanylyltransferase
MLDVPLGGFGLAKLMPRCSRVIVNVDARARADMASGLTPVVDRGSSSDSAVEIVEESPQPYGAAGTLVAIRDRLGDSVITWNADTITDIDLGELLEQHRSSGATGTVAVKPVRHNADLTFEDEKATGFINRHLRPDAGGGQFIGVSIFEKRVIERLPEQFPLGLAEAVLEPLAQSNGLDVFLHRGYSIDVGTFARYLQASIDLLEGLGPSPPISWPGEIVTLERGSAYVGPGADAASDSLRPGAVLLAGSEVEPGTSVERSIVWRGATVPRGETLKGEVWPWSRGRG